MLTRLVMLYFCGFIIGVSVAATPASKPAPVIPVPTSSEAYLTLQKNREAVARQIADLSARLAAMDEALEKADGAKKAAVKPKAVAAAEGEEQDEPIAWPKRHKDGPGAAVANVEFGRAKLLKVPSPYVVGVLPVSNVSQLSLSRMQQNTKILKSDGTMVAWTGPCIYLDGKKSPIRVGGMPNPGSDNIVNMYVGIIYDNKTIVYEDMYKPDDASVKVKRAGGKYYWWESRP